MFCLYPESLVASTSYLYAQTTGGGGDLVMTEAGGDYVGLTEGGEELACGEPAVQYEVECVGEEVLSAINMLAQASQRHTGT